MKINVRIILITFLVVVFISVSSSIIYYSFTNALLESRNTKNILNSANDFVFFLESSLEKVPEDYKRFFLLDEKKSNISIDSTSLDFVFTVHNDTVKVLAKKTSVYINQRFEDFPRFLQDNPQLILFHSKDELQRTVFYGVSVDENFLTFASQKVRAEIAILIDNSPYAFSSPSKNNNYYLNILESANKFKFLNNFDIVRSSTDYSDFLAVKYQPKTLPLAENKVSFIVFSYFPELYEFTDTMKIIIPVIILTGILLTLIFTLLFTSKFRKQISLLTEATEITTAGNYDYRVPIITKDEIGKLGITFNKMIKEIKSKESSEKQYSEFITIINQNISLKDFSNSALKKILSLTDLKFGAIYCLENNSLRTIASVGLDEKFSSNIEAHGIYKNVIESHEYVEMKFEDNLPLIRSALIEIHIKYILIMPIIFGSELLGIIELVSEKIPYYTPIKFLQRIVEQLAIGLRNTLSYEKLNNLVQELKKLNEDYHEQNEQIKGKNEELVKLHQQLKEKAVELEKEREKAVELSHVKSQFLASMSHELKTPLNSIIGLTELSLNDTSTIARDRTNIVLRNSKKLLNMINNILEFSQLESGKYEYKEDSFLLTELLNDVYTSSEFMLREKGLSFKVNMHHQKELLLKTDRNKVEHILLNLLSNAIKFTESGGITVSTELTNTNDLMIAVSDTGIGIIEEQQEIIFDEFKQLETGIKRKYSGAGLGLAICNRYAKIMNGKLLVESIPGSGSTFKLFLPGVVYEEVDFLDKNSLLFQEKNNSDDLGLAEQVINDPVLTNQDSQTSKESGFKILVVDDDKDALYTVGSILKNYGYNIFFASDGVECLDQIEKVSPDLVLLDIMMPKLDGFETIKRIRENEKFKNITVYALTAHAMLDDKHIIEKSGFDDLITKPIDNATIQLKVKQAIINNDR